MSTLQIVAVANEAPQVPYLLRGWNAFLASCRRYNMEPLILGWGQPWTGLGSKPKLLKKAIEDGRITTPYILFADSFDVVFCRHPQDILDVYQRNWEGDFSLMWNAEKDCFPEASWAQHHPSTTSPWKYLNSGLTIGHTEALLQVLTEMKVTEWPEDHQKNDGSWFHVNDQHHFMEKFLFGQCAPQEVKTGLDSECSMFQTMTGMTENEFEWENDRFRNTVTGQYPGAIHFNGPAKTAGLMEPILKHLGL